MRGKIGKVCVRTCVRARARACVYKETGNQKHRKMKKPKAEKLRLLQDVTSMASVLQKAGPSLHTGRDTTP